MAELIKVRLQLIDPATGLVIEDVDPKSSAGAISTVDGKTVQVRLDEIDALLGTDGSTGGSEKTLVEKVTDAQNAANAAQSDIDTHSGNADVHVEKAKRDATVVGVDYTTSTGIFKFTKYDGTSVSVDTKLEKLAINFALSEDKQSLIITLDDGTTQTVPLSSFIDVYTGSEGPNVVVAVDPTTREISATLVDASIPLAKLASDVIAAMNAAAKARFTDAEKTKLEGIEEGANKYVLPDTLPASMITETDDKKFVTPEQIAQWNSNTTYTSDVPTVNDFGGVPAGSIFSDKPIADLLDELLHPYVAPIVTAKITPTDGGVVETGTSQNVTGVSVTVTRKSSNITKIEVLDGTTVVGSKTDGPIASGTYAITFTAAVTTNKQYTVNVTDATGKVTTAKTGTYTFVYPFYYGAVDASVDTLTSANITALTKVVQMKGSKSLNFTATNQKMVFAYPASYGNLTKILDANSFDVTGTFTQQSVQVNGVAYYAYINNASTVAAFKMTFNF